MYDQDQTPAIAREEPSRELPEITPGMSRRGGRSADGRRTGGMDGTVSPALALGTSAVTGILAVILVSDAVQYALLLNWTAIDMNGYGSSLQTNSVVNTVQTLVVLALVVLVLVLGALCVGRRQGAVRIGGGLAVLSVCLLAATLQGMPVLSQRVATGFIGVLPGLGSVNSPVLLRFMTALPVGLPALAAGFAAALLLVSARSSRPSGGREVRTVVAAAALTLPVLLLSLLVLVRALGGVAGAASWWRIYGIGMPLSAGPGGMIILMTFLVCCPFLAALAAGLLLGSRHRAAIMAGGALLTAVALPLVVQIGAWGMTSVIHA